MPLLAYTDMKVSANTVFFVVIILGYQYANKQSQLVIEYANGYCISVCWNISIYLGRKS